MIDLAQFMGHLATLSGHQIVVVVVVSYSSLKSSSPFTLPGKFAQLKIDLAYTTSVFWEDFNRFFI